MTSLEKAAYPDSGLGRRDPSHRMYGNCQLGSAIDLLNTFTQYSHHLREEGNWVHLLFNTFVTNPQDFPVVILWHSIFSFLEFCFPS